MKQKTMELTNLKMREMNFFSETLNRYWVATLLFCFLFLFVHNSVSKGFRAFRPFQGLNFKQKKKEKESALQKK